MEKPEQCRICGEALEQPETGRPRVYHSVACRRAAEYELRRLQGRLALAEKRDMLAREAHAESWDKPSTRRTVKFWAGEVDRLQARLLELLAGTGDALV